MNKFKLGRYKVIIFAAAIIFAGAGVLITAITVAQGAEENRIVAEQSENTDSGLVLAASSEPTVDPAATATSILRPEFITEDEAKEAYIKTAEETFGMNADKSKLTAEIEEVTGPHEWWYVKGKDTDCYIDAVSGEVLQFRLLRDGKYTGKTTITLEESMTDQYSTDIAEDPNNVYSKKAAEIVTSKLANGHSIESVEVAGSQFVWANEKDGLDPKAKGTVSVDVLVLMEIGRSYRFTFWGTEEIELIAYSSHPTQDACHWYYFYEDQAEEYSGHA